MTEDPRIDPADLRNVRFPGSSRRYDARAVDQFLETVATRIAATNELVDELQARISEIDVAAPAPVTAPAPPPPELSLLDDDELVGLVGAETASVLSTARRAAEEIRSKAEESAARMIREATAEADRLTDEAEARATELTSEAEQALEQATTEATTEAERIRAEAAEEADATTAAANELLATEQAAVEARRAEADAEVEAILEAARDEGRGMVNEAKEVRTRILEDLQRRRDIARDHIERLLDGRERLLAAYGLVRDNLDDITGQLADALPDPGEPELPDGFVGIVGGTAPSSDADAEDDEVGDDDGAVDPEDTVDEELVAVEPDDTVAPISETEADIEGVDDTVDGPAAQDESDEADEPTEGVVEVEEAGTDDAEPDASGADEHDVTELEADEADAHAPGTGGDVDELFARLRAEREASVAKARQVVGPEAGAGSEAEAEPEPEAEAESEAGTAAGADAEEAVEELEVSAADDDADGTQADDETTEDRAGGDVDRVPAEFLADEDALTARSDALGPLGTKLNRALKRRLADEQNELLDLLRRSGTTTAAELLPDLAVQVDGYAGLATKHLQAAAVAGGDVAGGAGTIDVTALAQALGAALVEPFRRRVERSASEVDGDPDELDERLRALYREWKVQHIGPVADDALLSAYALGTLTAAEPDGRVRWLIDPSQGPCPDAQDNALAGEVGAGEPFPTGDACPQAHPGCRCLLVRS